ncbi:MAG: DUF3048 domain-containing protein [Firmicutes bacterium]|nr:DUF3048 domain-containing protein [Bacillota bacterium]
MKKKYSLLLVILLMAVLVFGCGEKGEPPAEEEPDDGKVAVETVAPVCVMIDNHRAARPHSGLQEAHLVYEFLVEGGISRLMAVFDRPLKENFEIGPVRSLRPYFAEMAVEHGGAVAFSGTSGRTDEMIAHLPLQKITAGKYFWRDDSRQAPHNLYTDLAKLYEARGESQAKEIRVLPQELPAGEEALEIEVVYSRDNVVSYKYSPEKDMYLRFQNGEAHVDRETGLQYGATRVIVRQNVHHNVPGTPLVDIEVHGSGTAVLYAGGQKYDLTWEKNGETVYYLNDGTILDLSLGNTWIQVVR